MLAIDFDLLCSCQKKIANANDTIEVDSTFGYTTNTSPELGHGKAGWLQCLGTSQQVEHEPQFVTHAGSHHHWTLRSDQQNRGRHLLHVAQTRQRVLTPHQPRVAGPLVRPVRGNAGPALDQSSTKIIYPKLSSHLQYRTSKNIYEQIICECMPPKP